MAEEIKDQEPQTPPPAKSEPTAQEKLKQEFELDDSSFDPELDAAPAKKPVETPKVEAPKTEAPAKPTHNSLVVEMAQDLGLSDQEIDRLSPDQLGFTVRALTKDRLAQLHAAKNPPVTPPKKEEEEAIDWGTDDDGNALTEQSYAPAVARTIKKQHEQDKENKSLKDRLAAFEQREMNRVAEREARTADEVFAKHSKLFGTGTVKTINHDSPEFQRRIAVLSAAARMAGKGASREEVLTYLPKAIETLFNATSNLDESHEEPPPVEKKNGKSRISKEEWEDAALASPTQRTSHEPKGERRAMKAVAKKLQEGGTDFLDGVGGIEESNLPD